MRLPRLAAMIDGGEQEWPLEACGFFTWNSYDGADQPGVDPAARRGTII